jgi:lambda family phage tail tape measure protein
MASQNIARLGVVLGLDTAEFTASIDKAISENAKLKNAILRDNNAAAAEITALKNATDDYGKTLTRVQIIERESTSGRFMNATKEMKQLLLEKAKAYDAVAASTTKATSAQFKMNEQQKIQLTYQTTDLFTQLASGQSPLIAVIQQGGQLKDAMGGVGNMFKAIGSLLTPMVLKLTAITAVFGTLAYAAYKGRDEFDKFNDTLTLTGNYAGINAHKFIQMSIQLAQATNMTVGSARDALSAVVGSGKFAENALASVTQAILQYAQIAGVDAATAADKLMSGLDGTASGAKSLNQQMNFLTLAQYKQIEALEKSGKQQEAAKIASDALNTQLARQRRELGYLESAWQSTKNVVSDFWDLLKSIGRPESTNQVIDALDKQIAAVQANLQGGDSPFAKTQQKELQALKEKREALLENSRLEARSKAANDVGNAKQKIEDYAAAGGIAKARQYADEVAKAEAKAKMVVAMATANDMQKVDLEAQNKIADVRSEMAKRNEEERFVFASKNAELLTAKLKEIEADRANKIREIKLKASIKEQEQLMQIQEEFALGQVARENEIYDIRKRLAGETTSKREELEFSTKLANLEMSMLFATEKELSLAKLRLETEKEIAELKKLNLDDVDKQIFEKQIRDTAALKENFIGLQDNMKRTKEISDSVWSNMSSAIDNFVRTGKLNFKDLARSIIQDLIAIHMKAQALSMLNAAFSFFSGVPSNNSTVIPMQPGGGYADGGNPPVGKVSLVGERGPELFIPRTAGTIIPNNALSNMGSVTNVTNNYINAIDTKSFEDRLLGSSNAIWAANKYGEKNLATNYGRT